MRLRHLYQNLKDFFARDRVDEEQRKLEIVLDKLSDLERPWKYVQDILLWTDPLKCLTCVGAFHAALAACTSGSTRWIMLLLAVLVVILQCFMLRQIFPQIDLNLTHYLKPHRDRRSMVSFRRLCAGIAFVWSISSQFYDFLLTSRRTNNPVFYACITMITCILYVFLFALPLFWIFYFTFLLLLTLPGMYHYGVDHALRHQAAELFNYLRLYTTRAPATRRRPTMRSAEVAVRSEVTVLEVMETALQHVTTAPESRKVEAEFMPQDTFPDDSDSISQSPGSEAEVETFMPPVSDELLSMTTYLTSESELAPEAPFLLDSSPVRKQIRRSGPAVSARSGDAAERTGSDNSGSSSSSEWPIDLLDDIISEAADQ